MLLLLVILLFLILFGGLGVGYRGGYYDANGMGFGSILLIVIIVVLLLGMGGFHRQW